MESREFQCCHGNPWQVIDSLSLVLSAVKLKGVRGHEDVGLAGEGKGLGKALGQEDINLVREGERSGDGELAWPQ